MKHSVSVTCCALLVSSISLSYAAEVPSGTVLAEKQELVRHIKDEPASLDPAKAVGLPEIQVIRDLFEGLVNQNEKGEIVPGVATQWKSNDNRIWTFTLRDNAILSTAGSVWWTRKRYRHLHGLPRWRESTTHRRLLMVKLRLTSLASPQLMPIL